MKQCSDVQTLCEECDKLQKWQFQIILAQVAWMQIERQIGLVLEYTQLRRWSWSRRHKNKIKMNFYLKLLK